MASRIGLGELFSAAPRAVGRYTGTLLAVFVVQTLVAGVCMVAMAAMLAQVFAHVPLWDEAVDGDLAALFTCIRFAKSSMLACAGIVFAGVLLWLLASWFFVGGIYGVLAQRPEGRADTARCFGASGASTYLPYARLAACSLPGWVLVLFVFGECTNLVITRIEHALTVTDLMAPIALATLPALLVLHLVWTISDYARVELTLRSETHDPGVVATYVRTIGFVLRQPMTLVHGLLGWLGFVLLTITYAYFAHGHLMYGAEGAVTLFVIRQGVVLARTAIRFGVLAGQLELGRTRASPSRRVEVKVEPNNP